MKKFGVILFLISLLCGCVAVNDDFIIDRVKGIESIEYEALVEKIENNHDFILYIGRSDCGDCIEFYPYLEDYLNKHNDLGVYYLDVKAFRDNAYKEDATQEEKDFFKNIYTYLDYDWTPTLQHRRGEEVLNRMTYLSMEYYELEDEQEKVNAKKQNLDDIYQWLEKECGE